MLKVDNLNQYYGGSHILRNLSFEVPPGKVTALLGRNGVGKTTLLKALMGVIPARSGRILFDEKDITNDKPYERVRVGLGYVPLLLSLLPASLNLLCTWPRRNTTAAITASAMRATRRMYSTMLAPRSSLENLAWSHVFKTNRFMLAPSFVPDPARVVGCELVAHWRTYRRSQWSG